MVFLFVFLIIILMIITLRVKFRLINLKFTSNKKQHINKDYKIKVTIYTFFKIPILNIKINNKKIQKIINNDKIKKTIKKQETKIIENKNNFDKEIIKQLKNIKIELNEMDLKIFVGTENASITAFAIPVISTIIATVFSKSLQKYNEKQIFSITPVYINQNLINIEFSGIFQIKMIHIINTICIVNKKRKGDKYERTSNRRSYDYSYE